MRFATVWSLALTIVIGIFCMGTVTGTYMNPIIPGFNPDPSITRVGNDYFVVTSSFEFFPGVPIYHSTDLIKWTCIGHALNRPSQLNMRGTASSGGVYAPTIRYHNGTYYMIVTWFDIINPPDIVSRLPRAMYVTTTNIWDESTWSDPTYVDQWGIDPDLFFDDDGKVYLSSSFGAADFGYPNAGYFSNFITEIDITTGNSLTETTLLHISPLPLDAPRLSEGSHIYKFNGTYYLMTAEGGTANEDHREMIYRSTGDVYGPYEANPNNPLIFNGHNLSNPVLATGHADLVQTPAGDWFAVLLATRPQNPMNDSGANQLGRETFLTPVTWEDGWPVFNGGMDLTLEEPGLYYLPRAETWIDPFQGGFADKKYYTPRTPYKNFTTFLEGGGISMRGNVYNLTDRETPAVWLRRQEDINVLWQSELTFEPTSWRHEAGVTVYLSSQYHNEIGITQDPTTNKTVIFANTRTGVNATLETTYADVLGSGSTAKLFIKAQSAEYSLGYAIGGAEPTYIATVANKWLQAYVQGYQNYVGTHFGIYTSGNELPILQSATFKYVRTDLI